MSSDQDVMLKEFNELDEQLTKVQIDPGLDSDEYKYDLWANVKHYQISADATDGFVSRLTLFIGGLINGGGPADIYQAAITLACQLRDPSRVDTLLLTFTVGEIDEDKFPAAMTDWDKVHSASILATRMPGSSKLEFYNKVAAMDKKTALVWGPAFAALILRMSQKSKENTIKKLMGLNSNLVRLYGVQVCNLPTMTDELAEILVESLSEQSLHQRSANTLFLGMVCSTAARDVGDAGRGILEFLWTQALRYLGMTMLNLLAQARIAYDVDLATLKRYLALRSVIKSWVNMKAVFKYLIPAEKAKNEETKNDKLWPYIRAFNPSAFSQLSYKNNSVLISMLAVLIDYKEAGSKISHSRPGPAYSGQKSARGRGGLTEDTFNLALVIARQLETDAQCGSI